MNIRLYNANILTMEKHKDIFHGEIWVKNEKIAYIAAEDELSAEWQKDFPKISWDMEIDCKNNLLMPGFKDAHTHSAMTFLRSRADDVPLDKWLNEKVFPAEECLTDKDIYELNRLAILEYLRNGITAIFDMYLRPEVTADACIDMGMRCVLTSGLNKYNSSIEQVEEEYNRLNMKNPLITYQLGFHAEYTTSDEQIYRLSQLARKYHAPVYTHLAETEAEVEACKKRHGMTPAMYLDTMGMFEFGGGCYHCVHMTADDMEVFRRRRLHVIANPASNLKLASGIAPFAEYERRKISVALGTDGPASNNSLDIFREMYLAATLAKIKESDASVVCAERALRMATVHGAKAMRLNKSDVLAKGKLADIIMIDLNQPNMQPKSNLISNLVYSGNPSNVIMTMIGGKILYRNGEYNIGLPKEEIFARCQSIADRIAEQSKKA